MTVDVTVLQASMISLGTNAMMHIFFVLVITDLFTGVGKALLKKKANSTIGLNGLIRHSTIMFIVVVLNIYLPIFHLAIYATGMNIFFSIQYLGSVIENMGEIGIKLPPAFLAYFEKLQDVAEDTELNKMKDIFKKDPKK